MRFPVDLGSDARCLTASRLLAARLCGGGCCSSAGGGDTAVMHEAAAAWHRACRDAHERAILGESASGLGHRPDL
jgi:hypothetical protein